MMPTENSSIENSTDSELLLLGLKEMAPFEPDDQKCLLNIFGTSNDVLNFKCRENIICNEPNHLEGISTDPSDINRKLEKELSKDKLDNFSPAQFIFQKRSLSECKYKYTNC